MTTNFTIPRRFCGPPDSGNGGYTCGLLARELGGVVECTLRAPVPLEVALQFERTEAGGNLRHEGKLIVEGAPTTIAVTPPAPVSVQAATDSMAASPALDPKHPFPTCFVCGPKRGVHDGLRIFPAAFFSKTAGASSQAEGGSAPAETSPLFVAAWIPDTEFGDGDQLLRSEFLWAAMDCPTGFAAGFPTVGTLVTGRLAVQQLTPIRTGASCVLMSWPLGIEGRKHFSAACLYQNKELCAVAKATWVRIEG
ncbi:MAG TPA: hypothetical protein VF532_13530 [Candidatus Angelobacter sp.]